MPADKNTVLNYVPAEICIVVAATADVLPPPPDLFEPVGRERANALYSAVFDWLNAEIPGAIDLAIRLATRGQDLLEWFEQDLLPTGLAQERSSDFLGPLQRPQPDFLRTRNAVPWVLVPRSQRLTAALQFYTLRRAPVIERRFNTRNDQNVRELVHLINRHLLRGPHAGWTVTAATPNWLIGSTPEPEDCPGPGAKPEQVPLAEAPAANRRAFSFPSSQPLQTLVDAALNGQLPQQVIVAVLDTCPARQDVVDKATALTAAGHPNRLLDAMLNLPVVIDGPESIVPPYFDHLRGIFSRWHTQQPRAPLHFLMPDHGLFVAGIIRDLAPSADVHLIRVLSDFGVGDLRALADRLASLPRALLAGNTKKLVINMSLVADLPISSRLFEILFPRSFKRSDRHEILERLPDICAIFSQVQQSLAESVVWEPQFRDRVLAVAAAGNDNQEDGVESRPAPRYPARYDDVLAVAALNRDVGPAEFSNSGDVIVMGNGVAVYGGDSRLDPAGGPPIMTRPDGPNRPPDGIVGLYSLPDFPLLVPAAAAAAGAFPLNDSGWAYWAGTSFATPIISGIVADYWADQVGAGASPVPLQVMRAVIGFQSGVVGDLEVPAIHAVQNT
jgi:hypothetical protein